jgi:DNA-binding transcriptional ArsR family regulator
MRTRQATAADLALVLESAFLRALAEPSRLELLKVLLVHGPADVGTIASHLPNERSVVSRHLKVLLDARIVNVRRESRRRVYVVDGQAVIRRFEVILAQVRAVASICCPPPPGGREGSRAATGEVAGRGHRRRAGRGGPRPR